MIYIYHIFICRGYRFHNNTLTLYKHREEPWFYKGWMKNEYKGCKKTLTLFLLQT